MLENPDLLDRSTAVIEMLIMLLIAFIIGFVMAWKLKGIDRKSDSIQEAYDFKINDLKAELVKANQAHKKLQHELSDLKAEGHVNKFTVLTSYQAISGKDNVSSTHLGMDASLED